MRCLVVEFFTAGGAACPELSLPRLDPRVLAEGRLMLGCFANQLSESFDYSVTTLVQERLNLDHRIEQLVVAPPAFVDCLSASAGSYDLVFVIAPETNQILARCCKLLQKDRHKTVSPQYNFVKLVSDKLRLRQHLASAKVPTATSVLPFDVRSSSQRLVVQKPRWGTAGEGVEITASVAEQRHPPQPDTIFEPFVEGVSASVAVVQGPCQTVFLPPMLQLTQVNDQGISIGGYLGSSFPLGDELTERAMALAKQTVAALPEFTGYIGIDLILARIPQHDCVIEINPRLTSSFLLLSKVCNENLAEAIARVCCGEPIELSFGNQHCEFVVGDNLPLVTGSN